MSTSSPRYRATHVARAWSSGAALALLACVCLSACTAAGTPSSGPAAEAGKVAPLPEDSDLDAGTYRSTAFTVPFEITVPDGWKIDDSWSFSKTAPDQEGVFLTMQTALFVPSDACAWRGTLAEIGQSAEAFVDAVTTQSSTVSAAPVEVEVGAYSGFEFDHSAASDLDPAACEGDKICIHSEVPSQCNRWYSDLSERETYRVVELDGQYAVFTVGEFHPVDPGLKKEARAVFDSIAFAPPDE